MQKMKLWVHGNWSSAVYSELTWCILTESTKVRYLSSIKTNVEWIFIPNLPGKNQMLTDFNLSNIPTEFIFLVLLSFGVSGGKEKPQYHSEQHLKQ